MVHFINDADVEEEYAEQNLKKKESISPRSLIQDRDKKYHMHVNRQKYYLYLKPWITI